MGYCETCDAERPNTVRVPSSHLPTAPLDKEVCDLCYSANLYSKWHEPPTKAELSRAIWWLLEELEKMSGRAPAKEKP